MKLLAHWLTQKLGYTIQWQWGLGQGLGNTCHGVIILITHILTDFGPCMLPLTALLLAQATCLLCSRNSGKRRKFLESGARFEYSISHLLLTLFVLADLQIGKDTYITLKKYFTKTTQTIFHNVHRVFDWNKQLNLLIQPAETFQAPCTRTGTSSPVPHSCSPIPCKHFVSFLNGRVL